MTIEDILSETGGFGQFQLFVLLGVGLNRLTIGWSMLQMSYVGMAPDWICLGPNVTLPNNASQQECFTNTGGHNNNSEACVQYRFVGSDRTIVNEWNLVCSLDWVRVTVTSIQMGGVFLGALVAGQLADSLGRKKILCGFVLEHAVLNFVAAFSVSWQMFAACRFFIGLGIGGVLVSSFPYPMEFLPVRWRPLVAALPFWSVGICVFALASWLTLNWSYLHITCGALSLAGLLAFIYVPESLRWLTVHNRMDDAHEVVMKIAVVNHKLQPRKASVSLQAVAWTEQRAHNSNRQYTYLDIFREWAMAQTNCIFCVHWFSLAFVYYGISLSASDLAWSVHLNIFLLALVEIPAISSTLYFSNRFGRKRTTIFLLAVTFVPIVACLIVPFHGRAEHKMVIITSLCLVAKVGLGAALAVAETWCAEFYPTVTRCLGLGTVHAAASIGALITPFVINLKDTTVVSFAIMSCLLLLDIVLCIFTPETKDLELADTPIIELAVGELPSDTRTDEGNSCPVTECDSNTDNDEVFDNAPHRNEVIILDDWDSDNEADENSVSLETEKGTGEDDVICNIPGGSPAIKSNNILMTEIKPDEPHSELPTPQNKTKNVQFVSGKTSIDSPKIKKNSENAAEIKIVETEANEEFPPRFLDSSLAPSSKTNMFDKIKKVFHEKTSNESHQKNTQQTFGVDVSTDANQPETRFKAPSHGSSPAPSRKLKRLDKILSGELFLGKTSSGSSSIKRDKPDMPGIKKGESEIHSGFSPPFPGTSLAPSTKIEPLGKIKNEDFPASSPGTSPATKPKIKRLDKINSDDFPTPSPGTSPAPKPKIKRLDKIKNEDFPTPSPGTSPAPSPKIKRLDKLKSVEHGKSKPRPTDESPPYIESSHNKNVRFSIY